jgi:hypothetical protein
LIVTAGEGVVAFVSVSEPPVTVSVAVVESASAISPVLQARIMTSIELRITLLGLYVYTEVPSLSVSFNIL